MTETLTIIVIAVGLAMDAFAVSITSGSVYRQMHVRHALRMALFFGAFQAIMPLIGYLAGAAMKNRILSYDHWIAFGLLSIIGGKMIYEAFQMARAQADSSAGDPASLVVVLLLSIATSIDALAVGVTLSLITDHIITAAVIIGAITFAISYLGCCMGRRIGHFFEKKIEILGGLVLFVIGLKILIEHLITGQ
ncbi:MAG: manganese efflux pump [Sedimentisphaerales bacterium]|nr:manganese efflux pump [Sedimentisphaerales bacterium]